MEQIFTSQHRATALLDCDRVVVFDEGKIIEEGSPRDLMQLHNGIFSAMIKAIERNDDCEGNEEARVETILADRSAAF